MLRRRCCFGVSKLNIILLSTPLILRCNLFISLQPCHNGNQIKKIRVLFGAAFVSLSILKYTIQREKLDRDAEFLKCAAKTSSRSFDSSNAECAENFEIYLILFFLPCHCSLGPNFFLNSEIRAQEPPDEKKKKQNTFHVHIYIELRCELICGNNWFSTFSRALNKRPNFMTEKIALHQNARRMLAFASLSCHNSLHAIWICNVHKTNNCTRHYHGSANSAPFALPVARFLFPIILFCLERWNVQAVYPVQHMSRCCCCWSTLIESNGAHEPRTGAFCCYVPQLYMYSGQVDNQCEKQNFICTNSLLFEITNLGRVFTFVYFVCVAFGCERHSVRLNSCNLHVL